MHYVTYMTDEWNAPKPKGSYTSVFSTTINLFTLLKTKLFNEQARYWFLINSFVIDRMGRKLRLSSKKHRTRRRAAPFQVSLPPLTTSPSNSSCLIVSLPVTYAEFSPPSLLTLKSRLACHNLLPPNWIDATNTSIDTQTSSGLTFCHIKLIANSSVTPVVDFTLKIADDFSWSLFFYQQQVEHTDTLETPRLLSSSAAVALVMKKISSCQICVGNPDEKFTPLATKRKGIFTDAKGKIALKILVNHNNLTWSFTNVQVWEQLLSMTNTPLTTQPFDTVLATYFYLTLWRSIAASSAVHSVCN